MCGLLARRPGMGNNVGGRSGALRLGSGGLDASGRLALSERLAALRKREPLGAVGQSRQRDRRRQIGLLLTECLKGEHAGELKGGCIKLGRG